MNTSSQPIRVPSLASLLEAAEHRRRKAGEEADFAGCLLAEIVESGFALSVVLWELQAGAAPRMISSAGMRLPVELDLIISADTGLIRRRSIRSGSGESREVVVISSDVSDGIRSILELQVGQPAADDGLTSDLADVFADLIRRRLVNSLVRQSIRQKMLQQVTALLHADLDEVRVANSLASDPVELLGCRRISVARRTGKNRWQLIAATGVNNPDSRSDTTRWLCGLIERQEMQAAATADSKDSGPAEPGEAGEPGRPAVEVPEGTADNVIVRPVSVDGRWFDSGWAATFEFESRKDQAPVLHEVELICRHAALSFANCHRRSRATLGRAIFGLPLRMGKIRTLGILAVIAGIFCVLTFWKTELRIEVAGKLVPSSRANIFAPEDGVIIDLRIEDGSEVTQDSAIFQLRNEDLDILLEGIEGDLAASQARLAAIDSMRGDRSAMANPLLSVEHAELQQKVQSLQEQAVIVRQRISRLTTVAPLTGRVYGDRLRETLLGRPVQRGQFLFEVADPKDTWQLELRIPEDDIRYVLAAAANDSTQSLNLTYSLATSPENSLQTVLTHLSAFAELDDTGKLSTMAIADVPGGDQASMRPGAGVIAYIHCGERSAGYVFFRRIFETIQRRWWFR